VTLQHPATRVKVVQPGDGRVGRLVPGIGVIFKFDGADTAGQLSIVEHTFDVGALVPAHIHTREDEFSIVLDGEIGFRSEDQEVVLGAGGYIVKPRNEVHAMWNAGKRPARMIEVIAPPGFDQFFQGLADMNESGAPFDFADVAALAAGYGQGFAQPDWIDDVIARYELTPAPRA
jgi:quercetin dioxygenase-like cupin family protein